jgi:hypothetical protein
MAVCNVEIGHGMNKYILVSDFSNLFIVTDLYFSHEFHLFYVSGTWDERKISTY